MPTKTITNPETLWSSLVTWYLNEPDNPKDPPEPFNGITEEANCCFAIANLMDLLENYCKEHGIKPQGPPNLDPDIIVTPCCPPDK